MTVQKLFIAICDPHNLPGNVQTGSAEFVCTQVQLALYVCVYGSLPTVDTIYVVKWVMQCVADVCVPFHFLGRFFPFTHRLGSVPPLKWSTRALSSVAPLVVSIASGCISSQVCVYSLTKRVRRTDKSSAAIYGSYPG